MAVLQQLSGFSGVVRAMASFVFLPQVTILNGLWKDFPQKVHKNLTEVRQGRKTPLLNSECCSH